MSPRPLPPLRLAWSWAVPCDPAETCGRSWSGGGLGGAADWRRSSFEGRVAGCAGASLARDGPLPTPCHAWSTQPQLAAAACRLGDGKRWMLPACARCSLPLYAAAAAAGCVVCLWKGQLKMLFCEAAAGVFKLLCPGLVLVRVEQAPRSAEDGCLQAQRIANYCCAQRPIPAPVAHGVQSAPCGWRLPRLP